MGVSYKKSRITWGCREAACCLNHSFQPCNVAVFAVILSLALSVSGDQGAASVTNIPFNLLSLTAWLISFLFWCAWRVSNDRWGRIYPEWIDHVTKQSPICCDGKLISMNGGKTSVLFVQDWHMNILSILLSWSIRTLLQSNLTNWFTPSLTSVSCLNLIFPFAIDILILQTHSNLFNIFYLHKESSHSCINELYISAYFHFSLSLKG